MESQTGKKIYQYKRLNHFIEFVKIFHPDLDNNKLSYLCDNFDELYELYGKFNLIATHDIAYDKN